LALEVMAQDPAWLSATGNLGPSAAERVMLRSSLGAERRSFGLSWSTTTSRERHPRRHRDSAGDPGVIYLPTYDPLVLFAAPTSGCWFGEVYSIRPQSESDLRLGWG